MYNESVDITMIQLIILHSGIFVKFRGSALCAGLYRNLIETIENRKEEAGAGLIYIIPTPNKS